MAQKNHFKPEWLTYNEKSGQYKLGDCIRKAEIEGRAFCSWCNALINFTSRGRVALVDHTGTAKHRRVADARRMSYSLGSFGLATANKSEADNTVCQETPTVPLGDRIMTQQV